MYIRLDHASGEPFYRQIVEQVKYDIAAARLAPGERLPSIRELASRLTINPRTVVKAYDELAHAGLVVMRQGQGVFVTNGPDAAPAAHRRRVIKEMAKRLLAESARIGADGNEVIDVISEALREMESGK